MTYFSDRELGEQPRIHDEIEGDLWTALEFIITKRIEDDSFGVDYPSACPDGQGPAGTDRIAYHAVMHAEIPNFPEEVWKHAWGEPPKTVDILDVLEFCWRHVAEPSQGRYHGYFQHFHLSFNRDVGRQTFSEEVNRLFSRNGLVYTLSEEGRIERRGPTVLHEVLQATHFQSGDVELDQLLETARRKFLDPREELRRESLLELWDAWERLKTTGEGPNKKDQITSLLDRAAGSAFPKFREHLETEALELTSIGNNHQIRHSEVTQEKVESSEHIDYLFHRLFSMIQLILKNKGT